MVVKGYCVSARYRVAVQNALDYQKARDRQHAAENVLRVIGSALILTDSMGDIRFANKQAEESWCLWRYGAQRDACAGPER